MPIPIAIASFNKTITNRLTAPFAGHLPGFAVVVHRGRTSGRMYRTPVNAFRRENDYVFVMTYGPDVDWVRNVEAAGGMRHRDSRATGPPRSSATLQRPRS